VKRLQCSVIIVVGLIVSLFGLAAAAPSAFAMRLLDQAGTSAPVPPATASQGGMAAWEITLIAIAASFAAIAVAAVIVRLRLRPALG
jgi:hypothetical protein